MEGCVLKVSHVFVPLVFVCGLALDGCGIFRRWNLTGGSKSAGQTLKFQNPAPLLGCSLFSVLLLYKKMSPKGSPATRELPVTVPSHP